ncbi:MAG: maltose alpha-D-glucosyltransferase [Deltaproteobacteria bacterium RBG_13_60_28]|nr:MAG: maltose alpha-D-glucosyltransferase [Deltaproteobacteria bacterium RBG_13_60_28]
MRNNKYLTQPVDDPLWYQDAVIYELHVRSFYDSYKDGIGDFRGLTEKLDYLQDLGVTAIWLLPFYPSPLRDDGYDIADYRGIHEKYGTLRDFKAFLREAKYRGLKVITELVINHTSNQHPWFQRARLAAAGSRHRQYYVWSDTPKKYQDTRIIFQDFESSNWAWDPVARAYYWHRFYSHQPDLNFDSPDVRREILRVLNFWLSLGVDGLRLDAVPYLCEREGTNCENLPETHAFLKELRRHVDARFKNRMLLAEANQWPEDAAAYFGKGDECHMAFHFPLMPRMFMALRMEDRFPIIDILQQTPQIPPTCQWALFLRNHDELTLEMVTDEERDYMYRVYSQDPQARINLGIRRRLAPLLGNHRRRIELMKSLLFAMPGTPVLYYGDEIGMGDNIFLGDRDGVRTPMQWSADRNAGFSRANSQRLYLPVNIDPEYHYESINVEAQQNNPHSLLWWMKRLIALRKQHKALSRGSIEFLFPENHKVLAFLRCYQNECILVVNNLSRFAQYVELDLSAYRGLVPKEVFARTDFPSIGEQPYLLTMGPHSTYWFSLEEPAPAEIQLTPREARVPTFALTGPAEDLFRVQHRHHLAELLPPYLTRCRWFGGKARSIKSASITEVIPFPYDAAVAYFTLVQVGYVDGEPETYVLPLAVALGERAVQVQTEFPQALVAHLRGSAQEGVLYEAVGESSLHQSLLESITRRRHFKGTLGEISARPTQAFRHIQRLMKPPLSSHIMKAEQSNTSIVFGDWLILKLLRRVEEGMNLDLEIGLFLTEESSFVHNPPVAGALEYRPLQGEPITLGILHGFVPNQGDAWKYTLDVLGNFYEAALASQVELAPDHIPAKPLLELTKMEVPPLALEMIGPYLESARLLGERTGELHVALASNLTDPLFAPEPFSTLYQRSIYQSMRNLTARTLQMVRQRFKHFSGKGRSLAKRLLEREEEIINRFRSLLGSKIAAMRIRVHGDFHLGQILYTGKDFIIIDFEGEPARSLTERRLKRSALRDVAGMLRSFHYAAYHAIYSRAIRPEDIAAVEKWAHFWQIWVSAVYLKAYLELAGPAGFLPRGENELQILLSALCLEKAVYELRYELNNRPDWVNIPLQGILQLLETAG